MPEGYALYMDGEIINIEGCSKCEGNQFENTLKEHWFINKIEVPESFLGKKYLEKKIRELITEAFISFSYCSLKPEQFAEVTVEINAEFQKKED